MIQAEFLHITNDNVTQLIVSSDKIKRFMNKICIRKPFFEMKQIALIFYNIYTEQNISKMNCFSTVTAEINEPAYANF